MEKFNRAERRFQTARLKKARQFYWGHRPGSHYYEPMSARALGKVAQYPCSCSCWMCGNPRRHPSGWPAEHERTIQERRLFQDLLYSE